MADTITTYVVLSPAFDDEELSEGFDTPQQARAFIRDATWDEAIDVSALWVAAKPYHWDGTYEEIRDD